MVGDNLRNYVRSQSDNGVDPKIVRYNLISSGWSSDKVDDAILYVYPRKEIQVTRGNRHLLRWLIIVIIIIVFGMLVAYLQVLNQTTNISDEKPPVKTEPTPDIVTCKDITGSTEKDDCYYAQVSEGFDCDTLSDDIEKNFCFRALDRYILVY